MPHRPDFPNEMAKTLMPLYNRLTQKDLLARCSSNETQNAKQSFNALIWKSWPKTESASLHTVETTVAPEVLEYNMGLRGFEEALLEMKMETGRHHESQAGKATHHPLARSRAYAP